MDKEGIIGSQPPAGTFVLLRVVNVAEMVADQSYSIGGFAREGGHSEIQGRHPFALRMLLIALDDFYSLRFDVSLHIGQSSMC